MKELQAEKGKLLESNANVEKLEIEKSTLNKTIENLKIEISKHQQVCRERESCK
jgi:hypothetical protein